MPPWLRAIAQLNPLTYLVDALRALLVAGAASATGVWRDFAILAVVFVLLIAVAARLYPGLAR